MQQSSGRRSMAAPAVFGLLLVAVGVVALVIREYDVNFLPHLGAWGWPLFVIVPGIVALGASLLVRRGPGGATLATLGAVVTTVGLILLYQSQSGHWESWAYAWALLPAAAGAALVAYGFSSSERGLWVSGLWLGGIALVVFVAGAWFFEGLFARDDRFIDAGNWWPVAVIVLGAAVALWAFMRPSTPADRGSGEPRPL